MKKSLISLFLLVVASLAASAQVSRHEINVGDFNRLSLVDNINVEYRCNADSAGIAVLKCTPEVLQGLIFTKNNSGRLSLQIEDVI